jgi:hypothetical protein
MRALRTLIATGVLCAGLLAPMVGPAAALAKETSLAGHWAALVFENCDWSPSATPACNAIGIPPSWSSFVDYERYSSDAKGNFTFSDTLLVTGNPASATGPACSVPAIFSPFTGSCLITARGTGHISSPGTHTLTTRPDFFIGHESVVFHSHPSVTASDPFGKNFDTGYPAVAGVYNTQTYFGLFGQTPPPGVFVEMIITHVGG